MEASARDVTSRSGLFGSPRSSLIARCPSHSLLAGRKRRRVLQWVLAQYRGGSTPRGETGPHDPSSAEEYPRGSDVGSAMASLRVAAAFDLSNQPAEPLDPVLGEDARDPAGPLDAGVGAATT